LRIDAEDFGYYSRQIPVSFFRMGTESKSKGITSGVHTPNFNINESAIETVIGMMAWLGSSVETQ
jgi:metal-dependent amidase/aminoacylase/carboxypeptidase family protein